MTKGDWKTWAKGAGLAECPFAIINAELGNVIPQNVQLAFKARVKGLARDVYRLQSQEEVRLHGRTTNLTPQLTVTHTHIDSVPHVATGSGSKFRAAGDTTAYPNPMPLKLWIIWPSTEAHKLAKCYGDTNAALVELRHGRFFVQMLGGTIVVPANAPHAVIALSSSILIGHTFYIGQGPGSWYPSTIKLDLAAGIDIYEACRMKVLLLKAGLLDEDWRDVVADQLLETWGSDAIHLRLCDSIERDYYAEIVEVLAMDIQSHGSCILCARVERDPRQVCEMDAMEHVLDHLGARTRG
ncbi:hypothetical protein CLAFUW4_14829 [Fulvia fulva]|nr:hypothetical protein CLAFUR0_14822 [Fulvia fulva]WPV22992.1 hypothetical protein CLAFUW4_14829 [Fulvia fulva]WPV37938.1 hypothetical protein CLAFUW7_14830 [Fulvia fulva]